MLASSFISGHAAACSHGMHCRDNARHLATQNDYLQAQMKQVEMDTIDVISFLKTQDQKKDTVVSVLLYFNCILYL